MSNEQTVTKNLDLMLIVDGEPSLPVRTVARYSPEDPLVVTLTFLAQAQGVRWTIARDLLWDGMDDAVGDGDVHVEPHDDGVHLVLHTSGGTAHFAIDTVELGEFLIQTDAVVAHGDEDAVLGADLDRTLTDLLGAA
ncbi:MAG TPA: SsgA family sporulation/cell division regulator [Actinobacteria bacterium]|nr:SsgA family sporulation/cell division regulator [Actinomycetota bacterium]